MIARRKAWGNQIEKGSDLEAAFSTYTIIVMFICAVASTAAAGSYVITRNRMFMYVAIAFFLYFFDLSFIFQAEYLNHGSAITLNALYEIQSPYIKAILACGILESLWLAICMYMGKTELLLQVLPGAVFIALDFLIACVLPDGPIKQWLFYSMREAFLIWCLAYLTWLAKSKNTSHATRALVKRQKPVILASAVLICCIIIENSLVILLWHPSQEMMETLLPIFISERNFSENILVILLATMTVRHTIELFRLRHDAPPIPKASDQERYVTANFALYCDRHALTTREQDILRAIIDGKDNQNIASEMHLALGTVKSHTHNIFKKTGTKTRQELLQQFWRS